MMLPSTTLVAAPRLQRPPNPLMLARRAFAINAPLAFFGSMMVVALLGTLLGLVVDHRVITGAPAWLKPAKFCISIAIYAFTVIWLLSYVQGHPRLTAMIGTVTAFTGGVEMVIIIGQVIRGTTSHFNYSTPLDAALFQTMAVAIVILWTMAIVLSVLLLRQRLPDAAFAWSLRLALLIAVVGMGLAFLMPVPTAAQLAAASAGHGGAIFGAHSVGVADGGAGLPLLGWSTIGGDLRIPHFFGLHGLQVLPALGWLLTRANTHSIGHRVALIWTAGLGYLGLMGLLTWQALRAQSIIHPDGLTLAALAALVLAVLVATAAVLLHARSTSVETARRQASAG